MTLSITQDLGLEKPSWLPDFGGKKEEAEASKETEASAEGEKEASAEGEKEEEPVKEE